MLPNGLRESERILRGTCWYRRKMLALTGTQASDGKMGPLQGVVGFGADRVRGVDRWLAGDSHQEKDNDEHGLSAKPSCLPRALPVGRHAHSVRRPPRPGAVPWGEDPSPLHTLPHSLNLHLQRFLSFLRSFLFCFFVVNCLLLFFCGSGNA